MIDVSSIKYIIQIVLKNIHKTKFSNLMFCFVACREKHVALKRVPDSKKGNILVPRLLKTTVNFVNC